MNSRQLAAIKDVEKAMKKASDSGLAFAGIDYELVCFSRRQFLKLERRGKYGIKHTF